jgi:hypothetical protein
MKTYYSTIKVVPNSLVGDTISIGMILSDDDKFFVRFSDKKIRIAKSLLSDNKKYLDHFIAQIAQTIESISDTNNQDLFHFPNKINTSYISYLHKYSNNLIQYDEPKFVKEANTLKTFEALYTLLVDKTIPELEKSKSSQIIRLEENINTKLIKRVENRVHTHIKFTDKYIPSLYFQYELDCIGLNGAFTGAKSLHFEQSEPTLQKDISNYYALSTILENTYNKYGAANNFYLISDEPEDIGSKEHRLWEKLKKGKKFNLIHSEEADIVARKIEDTNAKTFLEIE